MNKSALLRVERVCTELATSGHPITFTAVAEHAQIGRATLYRDQQLRAMSTNTAPDKPTPAP